MRSIGFVLTMRSEKLPFSTALLQSLALQLSRTGASSPDAKAKKEFTFRASEVEARSEGHSCLI